MGAVRHKGFIPWDDDIDIAMPRNDYEKFIKIASKELPDKFRLADFRKDKNQKQIFLRVEDVSMYVKDNSAINGRVRNAWIDIFPLDGMPKSKLKFYVRKYRVLYLRMMLQYSQFSDIVNFKLKDRPLHEKILIELGKIIPFEKFIDTRKYMFKLDEELKKVNERESDYYVNLEGAYKFRSLMKKDEIYKEGALYEFEGEMYNGPKEYDKYLTQIYGDYMKPPKEDNKNKHFIEVLGEEEI